MIYVPSTCSSSELQTTAVELVFVANLKNAYHCVYYHESYNVCHLPSTIRVVESVALESVVPVYPVRVAVHW